MTHYNVAVHRFDTPEVFQSVRTAGAVAWEAFSMGGRQMANAYDDGSIYNLNSVIYAYSAGSGKFEVFPYC